MRCSMYSKVSNTIREVAGVTKPYLFQVREDGMVAFRKHGSSSTLRPARTAHKGTIFQLETYDFTSL